MLISDEVLTGLRPHRQAVCVRAFRNIVPDILVLAKALGGGMPLGAFVGHAAIMQTLSHDPPLAHITTFGGHPVCCAAGLAALEVIVGENLSARAAEMGGYLHEQLSAFSMPEIADVRGIGLLVGIDFHSPAFAHQFVSSTIHRGVVINWTLNADTVVRLAPPLSVTRSEIDFSVAAMRDAMEETRARIDRA